MEEVKILKKISEIDLEEFCVKCENQPLLREISRGTSFKLKGRRWYRDGYSR